MPHSPILHNPFNQAWPFIFCLFLSVQASFGQNYVYTYAGTASPGYADGPALEAQFNYPRGICIDNQGNLYISDSWNHRIRKISTGGIVSTWAGGGTSMGVQSVGSYVDSTGTGARFYTPTELTIDASNNIYVADAYNHRIRKIDTNQSVTTLAGSGGFGPDAGGFQDGPGATARFNVPTACHATPSGDVYVGDGSSNRVRKITPGGYVTTFAGSGAAGFEDGLDTLAQFNFPRGITLDNSRNRLYVVDFGNHALRYIQLEPVSGTEEPGAIQFQVYPNPCNDWVTINLGQERSHVTITLSNTSGQELQTKNITPSKTISLNLAGLPPGLYYLSARQGEHTLVTKKLIKQ